MNYFFKHGDLFNFVRKEREALDITGSKVFTLKEKLKRLRDKLRWWNKEVFGWIDLRVQGAVKDLNNIDNHLASSNYKNSDEWRGKKIIASRYVWDCIHLKERIIRKKI